MFAGTMNVTRQKTTSFFSFMMEKITQMNKAEVNEPKHGNLSLYLLSIAGYCV